MKLFGKRVKKNVDPAVPPELKPYYQPSRREQLRRHALLILPLLATLLLAVAVVWGGMWLWQHKLSKLGKPADHAKTSQASHTKPKSKQSASSSSSPKKSTPQPSSHSPEPATSQSASTTPQPASSQPSTSSSSSSGSLVNTGPNNVSLLLPLLTAAMATGLFELRQKRNTQGN